jgi:iron complex outermembrane recepter protein
MADTGESLSLPRGRRAAVVAWLTLVLVPSLGSVPGPAAGLPVGAPLAQPLAAQQPVAGDTVPVDTVAVDPLEVTVLRTPFSSQAAPMAVSVLLQDDLRSARSGVFLEEALRGLPGVQVQNRFNPAVGERVAIRGFGARAQFGMRGVRVIVDGIPATLPDGQSTLDHLDIGSLGRVEAVRGPSSALYGNAAGGVLVFHSAEPATIPLRGELEQVLGSHGLTRTQATASGTVGGTGYRFSVSRIGWDGFRTDPTEDGDLYGASERLTLNSRLQAPLAGGELALTLNLMDLDAENPGSVTEELRDDPDRPVMPFPYLAHQTRKELQQAQAGARWHGPLNPALDGEVSVFGIRRSVINPIPFNYIDLSRSGAGARAQLSWNQALEWGQLRWYGGVEYELQDDDRVEFPNDGGQPGDAPRTDQAEQVQSVGVFLQASLELPGGARGLAGLRYDRHEFEADDRMDREDPALVATGRRSMDAVSPSVGVTVPIRGDINLFASLGTVFETPTTTELKNRPEGAGGFNPELEPQRGTSGEVGLRRDLGALAALEVTAFRTNLRNELIPFEVPEVQGQVFFRNVGTSSHTGVEATLSASSPSGLLRGDLTYSRTDARFRSYELDGEELGGNRVPGLAPDRAQASVRVDPGPWFASLSGTYLDRVPMDDRNTAEAPSYVLVDLRSGIRELPVGQVELSPWAAVTNLFDRQYVASAAVNAAGARYYEPGPGRSFQLGVRASF